MHHRVLHLTGVEGRSAEEIKEGHAADQALQSVLSWGIVEVRDSHLIAFL